MVLEDLHWASKSTLQLVHYLSHHLADHQILMVGTCRPEAMGLQHPVLVLRRRLTREGLAKPLRLSRLAPAVVETLVVEMSGAGEAVVPLAGRLYQETEGNPFFLMEIIKVLFQADRILVEEAAILPLIYWRFHLLMKPWVRKYPRSALGTWFWKDVIIEPH
jgi:predicted ATPase